MNRLAVAATSPARAAHGAQLRRLLVGVLLVAVRCAAAGPGAGAPAYAERYVYHAAAIRDVIADIEEATPYRFLYRDALITGKTVSFEADAGRVLPAFDAALRTVGLALQVDEKRRQVLLTRAPEAGAVQTARLTGNIVDAGDGARLPFATVTWMSGGRLSGVTANEAGTFHLALDDVVAGDTLALTASYVGYRPEVVRIAPGALAGELTIRLRPDDRFAHEVVVTGTMLHTDLDTTWHALLQPGLVSPFGEAGVLRSLQTLPSVSLSTALSPGMNVRGSRSDGFQVLLDGISIYNQTHLFGLFDAFNEDALQTVGFFYGVTPATYQGPPGGTLSFVTRTGSQARNRFSAGLSNTAVRATAEGPLFGGRGSWLVSGRRSYLDAFGWFDNDALLALGLDLRRRTSAPGLAVRGDERLAYGPTDARFYDLHAKVYRESDGGNRWTANVYVGGDATHQEAERFMQMNGNGTPGAGGGMMGSVVERVPVETRITWGNSAFSLREQRPLGPAAYGHSLIGFSRYHSRFAKDDFTFVQGVPATGPGMRPRAALGAFRNANTLVEWKLAQDLDRTTRGGDTWTAGYALHHFDVAYEERSALRTQYASVWRSVQLDVFGQYDTAPLRPVVLNAGLRSHYFSQGGFLRWSPRLQARFFAARPVSAGLGVSRNYQFLHRLGLPYATSTDVWVMSTAGQPPASVDNVTGGLYVKALPSVFVQAEVYYKRYRNLRQHETAVGRPRASGSLLLAPWLHDNTAEARGLELMVRSRLGPVQGTFGYTLSRVEIRNPDLNDGRAFRAEWDRTHQVTSHLEVPLAPGVSAGVLWLFATGTPNALAATDPAEPATLPAYHRLDLSVQYRRAFAGVGVEARATLFNAYDRDNTWYRSPLLVPDTDQHPPRLTSVNVDVYDLGLQPSFSVAVDF